MAEDTATANDAIELATELTVAWLNNPNNRVLADDVPAFLRTMHQTLSDLSSGEAASGQPAEPEHKPAVSPRSSVKPDHIISLIDGRPYKSLKRHLSAHGLTPAQYRERYNLKPDYPMVASSYAEQRRALALKSGLGNKGRKARARGSNGSGNGTSAQKASSNAKSKAAPRRGRKAGAASAAKS